MLTMADRVSNYGMDGLRYLKRWQFFEVFYGMSLLFKYIMKNVINMDSPYLFLLRNAINRIILESLKSILAIF